MSPPSPAQASPAVSLTFLLCVSFFVFRSLRKSVKNLRGKKNPSDRYCSPAIFLCFLFYFSLDELPGGTKRETVRSVTTEFKY